MTRNTISYPVGAGGKNLFADVKKVQGLLLKNGIPLEGGEDGHCGPHTIQAIKTFQSRFMRKPDGLVEPGKNTWKKLINPNLVTPDAGAPANANLPANKINSAGLKIIKESEGLYLEAYLCPANVWTIGYGHTAGVKKGMTITEAQADAYLLDDVTASERAVSKNVKVDLTSNQFSALVSFTFNVGTGNFNRSTLLKKLNAGDYAGAADQFLRWNKGGGKILPGLTTRRAREKALFLLQG